MFANICLKNLPRDFFFIITVQILQLLPLSGSCNPSLSLPPSHSLSLKISGKLPGAESVAQKHFGQLTAANCCAYKAIKQRERREGEAEEEEEGEKRNYKKNKINLHANVKAKANCKRSSALPRVRSRRLKTAVGGRQQKERKRER